MAKLNLTLRIPAEWNRQIITEFFRSIETQVNQLSEGRIVAKYNAATSMPTTGNYQIGDFVAKSDIAEAGGAGSKYIITGWICTDDDPLTFKEARVLTGN